VKAAPRLPELARRSLVRLTRLFGARRADADPGATRHALVGPAHLWRMKREFQIDFLRRMGLAPQHRLLDLGCGTLRGGIPLIEYLAPGHYTGIEVRAEALVEARRELAEAGLEQRKPELHLCGDLSQLSLPARFDFAWAFSVLIHMDDAVAANALSFAARQLAAGGALYANVNAGEAPPRRWQGFPVVTRPLAFYAELAGRVGLAMTPLGALRELGHVSGDAAADAQWMLRFARS
jgi:SAM-dependent methyltransferase